MQDMTRQQRLGVTDEELQLLMYEMYVWAESSGDDFDAWYRRFYQTYGIGDNPTVFMLVSPMAIQLFEVMIDDITRCHRNINSYCLQVEALGIVNPKLLLL